MFLNKTLRFGAERQRIAFNGVPDLPLPPSPARDPSPRNHGFKSDFSPLLPLGKSFSFCSPTLDFRRATHEAAQLNNSALIKPIFHRHANGKYPYSELEKELAATFSISSRACLPEDSHRGCCTAPNRPGCSAPRCAAPLITLIINLYIFSI